MTPGPTDTTARCDRCHRPLRSAKSIADRMGRTCKKRERQEVAVAGYKPTTVTRAKELIEQGALIPVRGRRVFQVVASNGIDRYLTAAEGCNCPAGLRAKHVCYHRVAVILAAA